MGNVNTSRRQISWGWIIFWFIVFWPIGIVLLIVQQKNYKSATLKSYKGVMVTSYILMGVGVVQFIMAISGEPEMFFPFVLFGGGGIVTFLYARKSQKKGEHYRKYINAIVNQNQTLIDSISASVGIPYNTVVIELQKMIREGYLPGAHVDVSQRKVILKNMTQQWAQPSTAFIDQHPQVAVVSCPGCSANNKVFAGQTAVCEYCGTFLQ